MMELLGYGTKTYFLDFPFVRNCIFIATLDVKNHGIKESMDFRMG
jgi:hypothetical protein